MYRSPALPYWSNTSTTFLFLSLMHTRMISTMAATPSKAGTSAMIQVGAATQFDSTSQKSVPKKLLQHPPRQKSGSEQLLLIASSIF